MINKKIITMLIVGGMVANIGMAASAYSKKTTTKTGVKAVQMQKVAKAIDKFSDANMQKDLKTKLDALVTAGTITQAQEDAVISGYKSEEAARANEMTKVKAMTETERTTYFTSKVKSAKPDVLSALVTASTITQAQSDAIKAVLPSRGKGHGGPGEFGEFGGPKGFGGPGGEQRDMNITPIAEQAKMKTQLDTIVKSNTITQAQEDSILAYFKTQEDARVAEMAKVKAMTDAERKTYFDNKVKTERVDPLAELVKANTITQAQSDAIKNILPGHPGGRGMHR